MGNWKLFFMYINYERKRNVRFGCRERTTSAFALYHSTQIGRAKTKKIKRKKKPKRRELRLKEPKCLPWQICSSNNAVWFIVSVYPIAISMRCWLSYFACRFRFYLFCFDRIRRIVRQLGDQS